MDSYPDYQEIGGICVDTYADKGRPGGVSFKDHITAAAHLIQATGYRRRDAELAALQQYLLDPAVGGTVDKGLLPAVPQ